MLAKTKSMNSRSFYTVKIFFAHQLFVYLLAKMKTKIWQEMMGTFRWTFLGPKPLKINFWGWNYFQKLFFEIFLFLFFHIRRFSKLKILSFLLTFWPISKQTADIQKNVEGIEWPAIDALRFGYHSFSVPSTVTKPQEDLRLIASPAGGVGKLVLFDSLSAANQSRVRQFRMLLCREFFFVWV